MAEEDNLGRPIRFSPEWPPKPEPKPMPVMKPTFSLAFKKAGWPPQTDDEETVANLTDSSSTGNLGPGNGATLASVGGNANAGVPGAASNAGAANSNLTVSPAGPGGATVKPKRAIKDYSSFFGRNAAPPTRPVYVLQPGQVALPEVFLGSDEPESS